MIPKKLYFIWIGSEMPKKYRDNVKRWTEFLDDYSVIVITKAPKFDIDDFDKAYASADSYMDKSDVLRYYLLYVNGGVYLDCDTVPLKRFEFDDGPYCGGFVDVRGNEVRDNFLLASKPGNESFVALVGKGKQLTTHPFNLNGRVDLRDRFTTIPANTPHSDDVNDAALYHSYDYNFTEKVNRNVIHEPRRDYPSSVIDDDEFLSRQSICGECEYLMDNGICKKCGCAGRNKSRIRSVHCPINKW